VPEGIPIRTLMVPTSQPNRPGTKLLGGELYFVVHETDNTDVGADAESQVVWLRNPKAIAVPESYHGSVDDHEFWQSLPFDEIGFHAADGCNDPETDLGCFRGLAIEGCVNSDGDEAQMRRNYAEIIARIAAGDPAFDWGSGSSKGRFDIHRIKQHIQVSNPGPNQHHCPDHMLNEGFWPTFLAMIEEQWEVWKDVFKPYPERRVPIDGAVAARTLSFPGLDDVALTVNSPNRFRCIHGTTGRTYPNRNAPAGTRMPFQQPKTYTFDYATAVDGESWLASKAGSFAHSKNFEPA
jgi:hypothetical protein